MRRLAVAVSTALLLLAAPAGRTYALPDSTAAPRAESRPPLPAFDPATGPTPTEIARLDARIANAIVRVTTARDAQVLRHPRAHAIGLVFRDRDARGEEYASGGRITRAPRVTSPLRWDDIASVDVRHSHVVAGLLGGLAVGTVAATAIDWQHSPAGDAIRVCNIAGWAVVGAGAGAATGGWRRAWSRAGTAPPAARPREHRAPGEAFAIGLAATVAPVVLAATLNPPGSESAFAWEASLALGALAGGTLGPAAGLASGGRGDVAARGLRTRGVSLLALGGGVLAVGAAMGSDSGGGGTVALACLGLAGGVAGTISTLHDLCVTPSATARGRTPIVDLGVDARGRLAACARF